MVDQTDPSAGTMPVSVPGPRTTDTVTSLSGNTFIAEAGFYMEDFFFDPALDDGSLQALDQFNGHDHDGLGYHYHVTREMSQDGTLVDAFPFYVGVEFAGVVEGYSAGRPPGGGGPPPGQGGGG